jgi:hypothetical protein
MVGDVVRRRDQRVAQFVPWSVMTTIAVLNLFCEWSKSGTRGPIAAITSWMVMTDLSPRKIGCPCASV